MNIPENFYRLSVKALILDDDRNFLLIKEKKGIWDFPGGGLDFGESPQECIKREIREEMGIDVETIDSKPEYFLTFEKTKKDIIFWVANIFYFTKVRNLDNFKKSDECVEYKFWNIDEILSSSDSENFSQSVLEFVKLYKQDLTNILGK